VAGIAPQFAARSEVPQANRSVERRRDDAPFVDELDGREEIGMAAQRLHHSPGRGIEYDDAPLGSGGRQQAAVWR
jgi:hypothetical protein